MNESVIAPCGIDCSNCELFENNVTEAFREHLSNTTKIPKELISCKGCRQGHQCLLLELQGVKCKTLACVNERNVQYCFECDDFPCEYLMPLADGANKFPQNIKLYNLCLMKKMGVDEWAKQSKDIRSTYFNKKIIIGEGGSKES